METANTPGRLGSSYSLFPIPSSLFTSSLIHFFTHSLLHSRNCSLPTAHCVLNHIGHKNPPKVMLNPMNRINLTVFLFACESAFWGISGACFSEGRSFGRGGRFRS